MEKLDCNGFRVLYCTAEEALPDPPAGEFVVVKTDCAHPREIAGLRESGFNFHERFIKIKINIGAALRRLPAMTARWDVTVRETRGFTDAMLDLACRAYGTDRRFHLEPGFDNDELAKEMIVAAARRFEAQQARIVTASHDGDLLGFCAFLPYGNGYYNAMGLTVRDMKGRLAAWPLYTGALRLLAGGEYVAGISSANVASLNLHIQLGAKVTGTEDWYILRRYSGAARSLIEVRTDYADRTTDLLHPAKTAGADLLHSPGAGDVDGGRRGTI